MPSRPLACQATERRNGTRGPALLGGEAIEQPVAAGAAQVGLAWGSRRLGPIGPRRYRLRRRAIDSALSRKAISPYCCPVEPEVAPPAS
jgi:hypothetical protein